MDSDEIGVNSDGPLYRLKMTGIGPGTGTPKEVVNLPWKFICWVKGYAEREKNIRSDAIVKINFFVNDRGREQSVFLGIWA